MPHPRNRIITSPFLKALKFWPCVCLLGPRQCGKTFLLQHLLWPKKTFEYVSLDKNIERQLATDNPELFLNRHENHLLVIDEAQKAPGLFDEIKANIDQHRRPGKFVLSGSILFSKKIGIRESLTGRTSTLRLDTMNLSETFDGQPGLKAVERYLKMGGMPGIFAVRDSAQVESYWDQWIDTTCERDLKVFSKGKLSGDLARRILSVLATAEVPDIVSIKHQLRVDARRIETHLQALKDLFVVREIRPHSSSGTAKSHYFIFDCGLAHALNATLHRLWQIWFLVEHNTTNLFLNKSKKMTEATYYQSRRGTFVDFVVGDKMHCFLPDTHLDRGTLLKVEAASQRVASNVCIVHIPADHWEQNKNKKISLSGWQYLSKVIL